MNRLNACHSSLLPVLLLLLFMDPVRAQNSGRSQQDQRGFIIPGATAPTAEGRTALVIGNAAYAEGRLNNPVNDATAIAAALQEMGFQVTISRDADMRAMDEAVNTFSKKLRQGGVGLFYFAGHGLQVQGENRHYRKYGFCSPNACNFNG